MTALQIMYVTLSGIGALLLLLSIIGIGDDLDLDVGDPEFDISDAEVSVDSPSVFSFRTLSTFLLTFGIAGMVSYHNGAGLSVQLISGFVVSLVVTFLYFLLMKGMYNMQGDSSVSSSQLIGKEAIVTTPSTSTGLIQVKFLSGTNEEYTARETNSKKLKLNDKVKILSSNSGLLVVEHSK